MTFARTGSFDWTTADEANSYVDAEGLHIVPTLTTESTDITPNQLINGFKVNMTTDSSTWGKCTSDEDSVEDDRHPSDVRYPCAAVSNSTKGQIINPVRSARLNTKGKKTIRYGRVEITARMPKGDWLWPAIWMMPQDSVYGDWPKSGEIDIAESRGNDARTYDMGDNIVSSALHWGTATLNDRWRMSYGEWGGSRVRYTQKFHTYGLEWSEKYLFTWLDGRLRVSAYCPSALFTSRIPLSPSSPLDGRAFSLSEHVERRHPMVLGSSPPQDRRRGWDGLTKPSIANVGFFFHSLASRLFRFPQEQESVDLR